MVMFTQVLNLNSIHERLLARGKNAQRAAMTIAQWKRMEKEQTLDIRNQIENNLLKSESLNPFFSNSPWVVGSTLRPFSNYRDLTDCLASLKGQARINYPENHSVPAYFDALINLTLPAIEESRRKQQASLDELNCNISRISGILTENGITADFCSDLTFFIEQLRDQDIDHVETILPLTNNINNEVQSFIRHCLRLQSEATRVPTPMWAARSSAAANTSAAAEQQVPNMPVVPRTF